MSSLLRATIVGINKYKSPGLRLHFACKDAIALKRVLENSTTFGVEDIAFLKNEDATRNNVLTALEKTFSRRSFDSNTIALFYFAGHGQVNPRDKRISLCCYDAHPVDRELGSIRLNDIHDLLMSCSAECVIAIIDACSSGGIMTSRVDSLYLIQEALQGIELLRYPEGKTIAIFAACASDENARENQQIEHGIFTFQLLRGWRDGEAGDKNNMVYLAGLHNFLTQQFEHEKQKPQFTIRSGARPIALWRSELLPSVSKTHPVSETGRSESPAVKIGDISTMISLPPGPVQSTIPGSYHPVELPAALKPPSTLEQDRNRLIVLGAIALLTALTLLVLATVFIVHLFRH